MISSIDISEVWIYSLHPTGVYVFFYRHLRGLDLILASHRSLCLLLLTSQRPRSILGIQQESMSFSIDILAPHRSLCLLLLTSQRSGSILSIPQGSMSSSIDISEVWIYSWHPTGAYVFIH
ncbi:hypothetical protein DPMN_118682 [Dreissena polymorpha]|uniref:Uncharacterized protein n=1 Tax=Dreissena polymorpha TaxID=45954 RepID=A0A9D4GKJ5_DREPO|nr:hypothetical protein DPMN_118682 [Dreissena polymorpha]